ncbi:hypothetical protein JFL55_00365 [Histophilus somni]|uniref:hypothetical protein n=1 Tax=Histophilus somni TaxID=731 RepID=UPI0018EA4F0C|nr:hypothetical protein [Histophilus somni]QQF86195.1 hypothetical protein JFL55_00365 [Histophilus somni]
MAMDTLEIKLSKNLKGIASIANGDKAKIALGGSNGSDNKITFKAGSSEVTLADGKFSGVSEISKGNDKAALKLEDGKATLESTKDGSSIVVDNAGATIKVGTNKASYTFSDSGLDLNSKKLTNLASGLGLNGTLETEMLALLKKSSQETLMVRLAVAIAVQVLPTTPSM